MTSLSRRKRLTTLPRTPGRRTTAKLALACAAGFLAARAGAQTPAPLVPLPQQAATTVIPPPPPLLPSVKQSTAPPRTLYFEKEPAPLPKPAAAPARPTAAAPAQKPAIKQVAGQEPLAQELVRLPRSVEETLTRGTKVPSPDIVFRLSTEREINAEIIREVGEERTPVFSVIPRNLPVETDPNKPLAGYARLSDVDFTGRRFAPTTRLVEPAYITHHRLYFEELNAERYGWEAGPLQAFVSVGYFIKDFMLLPYNFAVRPCQRFDTNYGKCLPGDPVPYLLYPTELSLSGGIAEAGTIVALFALIP